MLFYKEIGELVRACGRPWFAQTLQVCLQSALDYDYFLMARYRKGEPIEAIRHDFPDAQIEDALERLCNSTYIAEPIYRLHNDNVIEAGVFDMQELVDFCRPLPQSIKDDLADLIEDQQEEIGHRTQGWPEYLQETCLLIPLPKDNLIAISLYDCGLEKTERASQILLEQIFPAIAPIVALNFSPAHDAQNMRQNDGKGGHGFVGDETAPEQVEAFFRDIFSVTVTAREADIFARLLQGMTVAALAEELCISVHTAKTHRRNVYRKIGHGNQMELIRQFHLYLANN